MLVLELVGHTGAGGRLRLRPEPLHIGRGPTNDLVLDDPSVSARHVAVWASGGRAWVEDLHSRNGTAVAGKAIHGVVELTPGDEICLAGGTTLRLIAAPELATLSQRRWLLEDEATGASYAIRSDRFHIGPDADADIILPGGPAAVLLVDADGAIQLAQDDDEVPLEEGAAVQVGGHTFRVRLATDEVARTEELVHVWYPYRVEATLGGPGGPGAVVFDPSSQRRHTILAPNRAVLLYLLARTMSEHTRRALVRTQRGWCDDEEVARGVWGRSGPERQLKVLVCRLRAELRDAGFDPWVVEKRRGAIRLRTDDVHIS
ncbi:MAG TPA: FHA domain-containing protein [Myxococcota bacterium]|nr:FHA domain-containing protein [Myxococcota bacterium]